MCVLILNRIEFTLREMFLAFLLSKNNNNKQMDARIICAITVMFHNVEDERLRQNERERRCDHCSMKSIFSVNRHPSSRLPVGFSQPSPRAVLMSACLLNEGVLVVMYPGKWMKERS